MRSLAKLAYEDIAFEVCSAFERAKVLAVLVGGGAAAYYAPRAYETRDLDFVLHLELFGTPKASILGELGFVPTRSAGTYGHPEIPYTLEILGGPLGVGAEILTEWETHRKGDLVLHVISPMNSVKDRLAHAIHFHDPNAARQAAEVAKLHAIDLAAIKAWCESEGGKLAYGQFSVFLNS
jgi:hypothetical protein